jgi:hypothetical protein
MAMSGFKNQKEETLRKKYQFSRGKNRHAFDKNNGKHPGMLTVTRDLGIDLIYFSNETAVFLIFLVQCFNFQYNNDIPQYGKYQYCSSMK